MFKLSRRRDYSLQPLTKETADPNATTAAASAFMRGNPAQSLSSAAAAAALRAQPTTPTNVAEIPSKRTQRRTSSLSSPAGRDRGKKNKQQRSPSVSSLSERTFRSPSPGRTASRKQDVPPVPSIATSKTTAISLQTQNFQTASQKSEAYQHGSWFGPATAQHVYQEKRAGSVSKLTPELPESRSGSVSSSINFSYPRTRITSYESHISSEHDLVYDPNSRRMVSKDTLIPVGYQIDGAEIRPSEKVNGAKLVKRSHTPQGLDDELRPAVSSNMQTEPFITPTSQSHATGVSIERDGLNDNFIPNPPMPSTAEERLPEESVFEAEGSKDGQNQVASRIHAREASMEPSMTTSFPKCDNSKSETAFAYAGSGSETSVRSAHFASSTDRLVVKHEPPPRSLSPRKSAMKSALSTKSQSLYLDENLESPVLGASYPSKEDIAASQRKGARVSWNDNNTVRISEPSKFEEADSTVAPNAQTRQSTYRIAEELKTDKAASLSQDELMSPRPALPLFGSVRDKKGKEPEERQLVRPRERSPSPQSLPPSNSHTSSSTLKNEAISSIESVKGLSYNREQTPRNVANISKYREPLPVIAASTESLDHHSEDSYTSDDEPFEDVSTGTEHSTIQPPPRDLLPGSGLPPKISSNQSSKTSSKRIDASPGISNTDTFSLLLKHQDILAPVAEPNVLPGSFPHDEDMTAFRMSDQSESIMAMLAQASGSKNVNHDKLSDDKKRDEESDKDSIYSDAYEDLSETTDTGFISLNATLANPPLVIPDGNNASFNPSNGNEAAGNVLDISLQSSDDWERTKAYWKSLTSEERRRLEMEALQEEGDHNHDVVMHETITANGIMVLPDTLGYSSNQEQRIRAHQSQIEHPSRADLGTTTRHPAALQDQFSSGNSFRPAISVETGKQSKKNGGFEMKRGEESVRNTNSTLIDAQRERSSLQQSVAAHSDIATGSGLKKLTKLKRSKGGEQRRMADESQNRVTRPKSSHSPFFSTELGQWRQQKPTTDSPVTDPMLHTGIKSTLRRRGSDSSESSFVRSRAMESSRRGLRMSMRSNASDTKISLTSNKGRKRMTLRSLSPTMSHTHHHSITPAPTSQLLVDQRFQQSLVAPHNNRFLPRKDEDSTYDDHISDSSDDDMNTTPLTNRSMTGDEYEPVHSRLKHSIIHMYARNNPPDQRSSANTGSVSSPPKHDALKLGHYRFDDDGNAHISLDQPSSRPSTATQVALPRRQGLISTLRRKRDANIRESREIDDATPGHHAMIQNNTADAVLAGNSSKPNQALGWPLQNRKGGPNESSMTSPVGENGRRSAASGSIGKDGLTSDPRQQHELQLDTGSSDPNHANDLLSQEPKRKKFNSLRKMFKINN